MQVLHKDLIISNINEPDTNQPSYVIQVLEKNFSVANAYSKTYTICVFL
jgi:hypothetical protein